MSLGLTEMLLLLGVIVGLFGLGKLPTVMSDLGKGVRNFKAGLKDDTEPPEASAAAAHPVEPARLPRPTAEEPTSTRS